MELARIVCLLTEHNTIDVGAPMQNKQLCYEMIDAAELVLAETPAHCFKPNVKVLYIIFQSEGRVDVAAPLPPAKLCGLMLDAALHIIERYNFEVAPEMRPFSATLMGDSNDSRGI